jgi:hypothetical protein
VHSPERNLKTLEALNAAVQKVTMGVVCRALRAFDFEGLRRAFAEDARAERLFPREEEAIVTSPLGEGSIVRGPRGCYGTARDFARDLSNLLSGLARLDRCFFKPFRIFATTAAPRRARADLHLWLGGEEPSGARVGEKGDVVAELREEAGGWRVTRLAVGPRERFRSRGLAYADWTERAGLPTEWPDVGYPNTMDYGQILFGGIAVGDYDGDGWSDLYVARAGKNFLLRNRGDGTFEDVTHRVGAGDPGNSQSALFADFDNDGDPDLLVVNAYYVEVGGKHSKRGHALYRNDGGRFTRVAELGPPGPATGAAAADYDGDGLLDVYVTYYQDDGIVPYHHFIEAQDGFGNRLYHNRGGLRFEDVTARAGVGGKAWSFAPAWADYDEDGRTDLYVANDFGDSYLFRNRGDGTFEEVAARAGVQNNANGMSADWGDFDNDGRLDLYVANMYSKTGNQVLPLYPEIDETLRRKFLRSVQGNALFRGLGGGAFEERARDLGVAVAGWAWGANFLDYDNDGWLDLHVVNGFWSGEVEDDF